MGIFSTHVVMQAKTYVKDQKLGIQTFVVEIRDPKTYKIKDGVEVGDQGPKLGNFYFAIQLFDFLFWITFYLILSIK